VTAVDVEDVTDASRPSPRRAGSSRPLEGEPPTIDVAVGYSKLNNSPALKLFLSRLSQLVEHFPEAG
jgi:hypothetical protein